MKIICTTVVRAAEHGSNHGGLYIIDLEDENIIHYAPYDENFVNDNERGGERGLRGVCVLDDRIIVASATSLIELDKETFEVVRKLEDREVFRSIHEICFFADSIWVTSTAIDCIVRVDLDFNIIGLYQITGESMSDYKMLTGKHVTDLSKIKENDNFHINSISAFNERLVFGGLITHLYDFDTMNVIESMPIIQNSKSFQHNFYEYDDMQIVNLTGWQKLGIIKNSICKTVDIPRSKAVKYYADEIAENNWNRGLARKNELVFVGSSPARVLMFDMSTGKFEKIISLEEDMRHCIHGLEILEP
tara:strand:- start:80549 stop:81460 length:912 start_codon:yes stop_codon:yes gene_type:complete